MEIKPRLSTTGNDTGFDDVYDGDKRVAWAERKKGASLVLLAELSESQIEEADKLLASRKCDSDVDKRHVTNPPIFTEEELDAT